MELSLRRRIACRLAELQAATSLMAGRYGSSAEDPLKSKRLPLFDHIQRGWVLRQ
jgi:hypothetical protein